MKKLLFLLIIIPVSISIIPLTANARAGFSERTYQFYYTTNIILQWGNPSDICAVPSGQCVWLSNNNALYDTLPNLHTNFVRLNLPFTPLAYIIGRRDYDNAWIIYDVSSQQIILESTQQDAALNKWSKLGLPPPQLVDAQNIKNYFQETPQSQSAARKAVYFWIVSLAIPIAILAVFLISGIGLIFTVIQHIKTKKSSYLIWIIVLSVFFLPTTFFILSFLASVIL